MVLQSKSDRIPHRRKSCHMGLIWNSPVVKPSGRYWNLGSIPSRSTTEHEQLNLCVFLYHIYLSLSEIGIR